MSQPQLATSPIESPWQVEFDSSPEDFAYVLERSMRRVPLGPVPNVRPQLLGVAALGVLIFLFTDQSWARGTGLALTIVALVVVVLLTRDNTRLAARKAASRAPNARDHYLVGLEAAGLRVDVPATLGLHRWTHIDEVELTPFGVEFFHGGGGITAVPLRAFADHERARAFADHAQRLIAIHRPTPNDRSS